MTNLKNKKSSKLINLAVVICTIVFMLLLVSISAAASTDEVISADNTPDKIAITGYENVLKNFC